MIVIYVTANVNPEHHAEFLAEGQRFIDAASKMQGCTDFKLYQDTAKSDTFALYETWATRADFDNYLESGLLAQFRQTLGPMLLEPPQSTYYEASVIEL